MRNRPLLQRSNLPRFHHHTNINNNFFILVLLQHNLHHLLSSLRGELCAHCSTHLCLVTSIDFHLELSTLMSKMTHYSRNHRKKSIDVFGALELLEKELLPSSKTISNGITSTIHFPSISPSKYP